MNQLSTTSTQPLHAVAIPADLIPDNDEERLQELHSYQILYTPPEEAFDNITQMMAQVFSTPMAFISLVDQQTVYYKSQVGPFGRPQVPRSDSLCSLAIFQDQPTVFEDASTVERLRGNPFVDAEGGIRFYAGAPLLTPTGHRLGTACIVDIQPRTLSAADIQLLERFAWQVVHEMRIRLAAQELDITRRQLQASEERLREEIAESEVARQRIAESEARYRSLAAELEVRVDERTHALADANRHLQVVNAELRRSNDNLQQFAYVASHDLKEPLRKIQSFGDLLTGQFAAELPPEARDLVGRMQAASERMTSLIGDILAYSRIATVQEPFTWVSLNTVLEQVRTDLAPIIQQSRAVLEIGPLPDVHGDPSHLWQLFQNLISNALKFTTPGTPARGWVSARRLERQEVPPALATRARSCWEVSVRDEVIGFDEKYLERIFQLFQRLNGRSHYPGSGIGLAICKRVVDRHGGWLTASSQPGQGSTFRVYLPDDAA